MDAIEDGSNPLALFLRAMPSQLVHGLAELVGHAFMLGYCAAIDERPPYIKEHD